MSDHDPRLDPVLDVVQQLGHAAALGPTTDLIGGLAFAGCNRPVRSSAARLTVGDAAVWLPAPLAPEKDDGPAAVFQYADREHVLPVVRLCSETPDTRMYLTLADWLRDALTRWKMPASVVKHLQDADVALVARTVSRVVWYALFGGGAGPTSVFAASTKLVLPPRPAWVRPCKGTGLGRRAATFQVMTAKFAKGVPTAAVIGKRFRIVPNEPGDWGIDPVHTPEGEHIRLTGHLGATTTVTDRKLAYLGDAPPLSVSTGRIPFPEYDDPRRLLMAANMQTHAVPLAIAESPQVQTNRPGTDPPGVNLRVGYLAWQGLNHEDAWVLSASAAARLACPDTVVRTLTISAVELPPVAVVTAGQEVRRGEVLLRRQVAAGLLVVKPPPAASGVTTPAPESGDRAPWDGHVLTVETWDFTTGEGVPTGAHVPDAITCAYRQVVRVTLVRTRPLEVGDKLANRHGHKGVVGAILPDDQMPRSAGQPLDVLLDPIGVLNRSNWGQLHEAVKGGGGEVEVEPPPVGGWMTAARPAFVGVQFVMRMPHFAADRISASPRQKGCKPRAQRFGEMDSWAAWAHDALTPLPEQPELTPEAENLRGLLAAAGFGLDRDPKAGLRVCRLPLDGDPPPNALPANRHSQVRAKMDDAGNPVTLVFDPPAFGVRAPGSTSPDAPTLTVRWLPVPPLSARPPRLLPDGSVVPHELTARLRKAARAAHAGDPAAVSRAVGAIMSAAYRLAVGTRATGFGSSKFSALRREVFGRRVERSGRAVVAPGGPMELEPDEIGLPKPLAAALFGPDADIGGERLWLKRDPVLHRWGFLPVRARLTDGNAIRLPASILGGMGADFDGDTVAVFAPPPGLKFPATGFDALATDPIMKNRAMFVPGKQYKYGFHLAGRKPDYSQERAGLERLADDPGMGLGLKSAAELAALAVVTCKASKFDPVAAAASLGGRSLEAYTRGSAASDPIADVMVAAKAVVGNFGGVLRRILFAAPVLDAETVRRAQCLTEAMTQKALSVKAGTKPLRFAEFAAELREVMKQPRRSSAAPSAGMLVVLNELKPCLDHLRGVTSWDAPPWLAWLGKPHELATLLPVGSTGALELPLCDFRVRSFFTG